VFSLQKEEGGFQDASAVLYERYTGIFICKDEQITEIMIVHVT
jgi:hypothetical protein